MDFAHIDFSTAKHIYFIGIGGISMSALARILVQKGINVSGSDIKESELTKKLEREGIEVKYTQVAENITPDIDHVVYTAAISKDNPEFKKAQELNIPLVNRASLLSDIMKGYKYSIGVSGTHGKTSTTSMLSHILIEAKKDPTISVGGMLPLIGGNLKIGKEEFFLTEACEYTNSFLELSPNVEVILNIEADHLDFFKDLDDIRKSFKKFIAKLDDNGILVINEKISNKEELLDGFSGKVYSFGLGKGYVNAKNINYDFEGKAEFDLYVEDKFTGKIKLSVYGEHNILNALAAIATGMALDISLEDIKRGLEGYGGVHRRFEIKGTVKGLTVIDDYAHHPGEIEATIEAAKKLKYKRLCVVFQPHTYSRTKALLEDFARVLSKADLVVLADIYAAREKDTLGVSSKDIETLINKKSQKAYYFPTFDEIESFVLSKLDKGDICITMGAGDIYKLGEDILGI
jgi:UDP-N-acetylmuramate--L-alanine ligase